MCADTLRERRCTHVIIIVTIWVLGLVPMLLNWRAICGWRNDEQCYAAALAKRRRRPSWRSSSKIWTSGPRSREDRTRVCLGALPLSSMRAD